MNKIFRGNEIRTRFKRLIKTLKNRVRATASDIKKNLLAEKELQITHRCVEGGHRSPADDGPISCVAMTMFSNHTSSL